MAGTDKRRVDERADVDNEFINARFRKLKAAEKKKACPAKKKPGTAKKK